MKAFAYLRVSGKSQIEGDGFDRQRDKIKTWAAATGNTVEREFREEGISGTNDLEGRPAMLEMLAMIRASKVRVVVVERADRFARDIVASELLIREFMKEGVQIFEAEGGQDLSAGNDNNPTAKLIRQILGAVSEFDKCSIVLKLRAARERKKLETGRCEGVKPFGTLPGEAATLQFMENLREQGHTTRAIAEKLNHSFAACPTRNGRPWHFSSVAKILSRVLNEKPELS